MLSTTSLPDLSTLSQAQPLPKRVIAGLGELFLELVEAAELAVDGLGQIAARLAAALGAHDRPEQRMVGVAAAVVAHGGADIFRNLFDVAAQIFDALLGDAVAFERLVEVVDVRLVMLVVMDLHRLGVDVRLQGIVRIRQRRQCIGHDSRLLVMVSCR